MAAAKTIFRPNLFAGKVAVVSGGATGIGKKIVTELAHLGCKVVIAARNQDRLVSAAAELNKLYPSKDPAHDTILPVPCNIRKETEVKALFDRVLSEYGRVDYLVNNGGGQFPSPAASIPLKGWNAVVDTNLTGTFLMCKQAYHSYMKDHGGSIVNIITCMFNGWTNLSHSGAARAGVENLTKSLSVEWAQNGIRLNSVAPGVIYVKSAVEAYGPAGEALFNSNLPKIPARRFGTPEEVSAAVCYLLSPGAAYVSGITVKVDGAWTLYHQQSWEVPDHQNSPTYSWEEDVQNVPPKSKL